MLIVVVVVGIRDDVENLSLGGTQQVTNRIGALPACTIGKQGLVCLAFAIFYLVSGSIWLPIVAHAVLDILQGVMLVELFREKDTTVYSGTMPASTNT